MEKGADHSIPDALSRAPIDDPTLDDLDDEIQVEKQVRAITIRAVANVPSGAESLRQPNLDDGLVENLRSAAKSDPAYRELVELYKSGFPRAPE